MLKRKPRKKTAQIFLLFAHVNFLLLTYLLLNLEDGITFSSETSMTIIWLHGVITQKMELFIIGRSFSVYKSYPKRNVQRVRIQYAVSQSTSKSPAHIVPQWPYISPVLPHFRHVSVHEALEAHKNLSSLLSHILQSTEFSATDSSCAQQLTYGRCIPFVQSRLWLSSCDSVTINFHSS